MNVDQMAAHHHKASCYSLIFALHLAIPPHATTAADTSQPHVLTFLPLCISLCTKTAQEFEALNVDKMAAYHRKGLELQLEQFFRGAALAVALGRVLVLPRFVCYCDKHWTELARCRMPGAKLVGSCWAAGA